MKKDFDLTTVKGRLLTLLESKRMSQSEFSRRMGLAPTYINAMRKSMPADRVAQLAEIFPDLNRDWLLYGSGEMLLPDTADEDSERIRGHLVPLLPVAAFAGNLQMWSQGVLARDCQQIISPVPDVDCAIRISGDSMEPEFHDGSTLLLRRINERLFIPWGQPMVIDTANGVIVKCLYPGNDDFLEARSLNPAYPPISVPKDSVFGIYRVVGSLKFYGIS